MAFKICRTNPFHGFSRRISQSFTTHRRHYATPPTSTTRSTRDQFLPSEDTGAVETATHHGERYVPRWSRTPPAMKAPLQMDFAKSARNKIWAVNSDPARLDDMYNRLLGPDGSRMLPDELKWLAVTHKSFDQGRRGFNDRLALIGRLTLVMEATKEIVSRKPNQDAPQPDELGRLPFMHERLASVDNLINEGPKDTVGKEILLEVATNVGMLDVLRWKPRLPQRLEASGVQVVLSGAIMAIIGAITLQHGSVVASKVIRERILARMPQNA